MGVGGEIEKGAVRPQRKERAGKTRRLTNSRALRTKWPRNAWESLPSGPGTKRPGTKRALPGVSRQVPECSFGVPGSPSEAGPQHSRTRGLPSFLWNKSALPAHRGLPEVVWGQGEEEKAPAQGPPKPVDTDFRQMTETIFVSMPKGRNELVTALFGVTQ